MPQAELFPDARLIPVVHKRPSQHKLAVEGWTRLWRETRGEAYPWCPLDMRAIRNCLKFRCAGDAAAFIDRARELLFRPPTAWFAQNASPALLYAHWPSLGVRVRTLSRDERNAATLKAALEAL